MCLNNANVKNEKLDYIKFTLLKLEKFFITLSDCLFNVCIAGVFEVNCNCLL
jgi:hypothetical protein